MTATEPTTEAASGEADGAPRRSWWQRFQQRWKDTKPTEWMSLVFTLASLALALVAYLTATRTSNDQATFQREAEAPVLTLGTPLASRGRLIWVNTDFAKVYKRADRLYLDRRARRFVIPVRNGGAGIALTVGLPLWVSDCEKAPALLPATAVGRLGTYLIPSGGDDQLGYLQPHVRRLSQRFTSGGRTYRYSWNYHGFGNHRLRPPNLLIWYTDGARSRLRWTCVTYTRTGELGGGIQWAPTEQVYGSRAWPDGSRPG